jgi:single stranded DNA-binding protein
VAPPSEKQRSPSWLSYESSRETRTWPDRSGWTTSPAATAKVAKSTLTAISNTRRSGEGREEEATAIQWTLWGRQAENAAEFLDKGSHVNVVGRLKNNNYRDASGAEVFGYGFTCEEIDYLDSKAEAEARRPAAEAGQAGCGFEQEDPRRAAGDRPGRHPVLTQGQGASPA